MKKLLLGLLAAGCANMGCYAAPGDCAIACVYNAADPTSGCPTDLTCTANGFCASSSMVVCAEPDAGADAPQGAPVWSDVAVGDGFVCGIATGQIVCWGNNRDGQIDASTTADVLPMTVIDLGADAGEPVQITAGRSHACALTSSSAGLAEIWCWGNNGANQLGEVGATQPRPVITGAWQKVVSSPFAEHTCALNDVGEVWCWGANEARQINDEGVDAVAGPRLLQALAGNNLAELTGVRDVAVGDSTTCAVLADGQALTCTGSMEVISVHFGETSNLYASSKCQAATYGADACRAEFSIDEFAGALALDHVAVGDQGVCVETDAEAESQTYCWGDNRTSVTGTSAPGIFNLPEPVSSAHAGLPELGVDSACVQRGTELRCRGANRSGELGNGTTRYVVGASSDVMLGAGLETRAVALGGEDSPYDGLGDGVVVATTCAIGAEAGVAAGRLWCWGDNTFGQLSPGGPAMSEALQIVERQQAGTASNVEPLPAGTWTAVAAGRTHTCAIYEPADAMPAFILCWGSNTRAEAGDQMGHMTLVPQALAFSGGAPRWLSSTADHTCVAGETQTACWGDNRLQQITGASEALYATPTALLAQEVVVDDLVAADGKTWFRPLGRGVLRSTVPGSDGVQYTIDADDLTLRAANRDVALCAATVGGVRNLFSCPGLDRMTDLTSPAKPIAAAMGPALAGDRFCAITAASETAPSTLACASSMTLPVVLPRVSNLGGFTDVGIGIDVTCAQRTEVANPAAPASLHCFGATPRGECGPTCLPAQPSDISGWSPVVTPAAQLAIEAFDVGEHHVCAITPVDGNGHNELYCWGSNSHGQLGTSAVPTGSASPTEVRR